MTARQQWSQGLEWGGWAWVTYVAAHELRDLVDPAWRSNPQQWPVARFHLETGWPAESWLAAALWLVAAAMIAIGAKRARTAVAAAILAQAVLGASEGLTHAEDLRDSWVWGSHVVGTFGLFVPLCLPALPLVFFRVERPRVVLSLLGVGRWREAWARSGGVGVLMVTIAVLWMHVGLRDLFRCNYRGFSLMMLLGSMVVEMRLSRLWWMGTALFIGLAFVAVWASASASSARSDRS